MFDITVCFILLRKLVNILILIIALVILVASSRLPTINCFFTVGLNIYVRYKQIEHHLSHHNNIKLQRANHVSLYIGLIAAFGMSMVGNFQVSHLGFCNLLENVSTPHYSKGKSSCCV